MAEMFQHAYADLGDVRLHYVTAGRGPAVVLLHGWPQTWYMWRDVMPGLARFGRLFASRGGLRQEDARAGCLAPGS